jgi:hypothetical protein
LVENGALRAARRGQVVDRARRAPHGPFRLPCRDVKGSLYREWVGVWDRWSRRSVRGLLARQTGLTYKTPEGPGPPADVSSASSRIHRWVPEIRPAITGYALMATESATGSPVSAADTGAESSGLAAPFPFPFC